MKIDDNDQLFSFFNFIKGQSTFIWIFVFYLLCGLIYSNHTYNESISSHNVSINLDYIIDDVDNVCVDKGYKDCLPFDKVYKVRVLATVNNFSDKKRFSIQIIPDLNN